MVSGSPSAPFLVDRWCSKISPWNWGPNFHSFCEYGLLIAPLQLSSVTGGLPREQPTASDWSVLGYKGHLSSSVPHWINRASGAMLIYQSLLFSLPYRKYINLCLRVCFQRAQSKTGDTMFGSTCHICVTSISHWPDSSDVKRWLA